MFFHNKPPDRWDFYAVSIAYFPQKTTPQEYIGDIDKMETFALEIAYKVIRF
jgi:hypothetical protein